VPIKVQKIFSYNAPLNNLQFFEIKIFKWKFFAEYFGHAYV
jgi:hypothetical protein